MPAPIGAYTIGLSCNADSSIAGEADLAITPVVGPEILSGSTRLKAGHGDQAGAEHAHDRRDGAAGQELRQLDGRSAGDQ